MVCVRPKSVHACGGRCCCAYAPQAHLVDRARYLVESKPGTSHLQFWQVFCLRSTSIKPAAPGAPTSKPKPLLAPHTHPLWPTQMHGREECVQLLLCHGARHDTVSIGGHTVLHLASANRHCDVVKRLVEAGARVNVRNAHGNTPLHSAAATGTVDILLVS